VVFEERQDEQAVARVAVVDVARPQGWCTRVPRDGEPPLPAALSTYFPGVLIEAG
jgi:hypothetical protein